MTLAPLLVKIAVPFVSALVTGVVKYLVAQYGGSVPSWAKPIIAAGIGAVTLATTGDPTQLAESAVEGALLGGGAPAVRETFTEIRDRAFANG